MGTSFYVPIIDHAVILGLDPFDDVDRMYIIESWGKCDEHIWRKKYDSAGNWCRGQAIDYLTPEDIAYVTGYIQKKLTGPLGKKEYEDTGRIPPYATQSKKIGLRYAETHKKQLEYLQCVSYKGHALKLPRYYRDKLEIARTDSTIEIKSFRSDYQEFMESASKIMADKYGPEWMLDSNLFHQYENFTEKAFSEVLKRNATAFQRRFI